MLLWVFGAAKENKVTGHTAQTASGELELERANVNWMLSIDANTLPNEAKAAGKRTYRNLTIDGEGFEFSDGFTELHTKSYEEILKGNGFRIKETKAAIELVHKIRGNK
jgi:UDP-N-acetyl-2-amino-2-deoxyglucuronate dehydrogenase